MSLKSPYKIFTIPASFCANNIKIYRASINAHKQQLDGVSSVIILNDKFKEQIHQREQLTICLTGTLIKSCYDKTNTWGTNKM